MSKDPTRARQRPRDRSCSWWVLYYVLRREALLRVRYPDAAEWNDTAARRAILKYRAPRLASTFRRIARAPLGTHLWNRAS